MKQSRYDFKKFPRWSVKKIRAQDRPYNRSVHRILIPLNNYLYIIDTNIQSPFFGKTGYKHMCDKLRTLRLYRPKTGYKHILIFFWKKS